MRLDAVLELEPGQVAGEQEVALDGANVDRALGADLRSVVGEEIAIGGELRRPLHAFDVTFHHLDLDRGAVGIEFLHRHDGAREHVAVAAVFGGDALGEVVDRLQRHLLADEVGVELGELCGAVDRRADDANLADDEGGLRGPRRCLDAGHGNGRPPRLRQWHGRRLEALALAAGLVARRHKLRTGRNDLRDGGERNAHHRHCRRNGAYAS
jgi:hypothetical protein